MDNRLGNHYLHEVAITAIIVKDGKYLITRRAKTKKKVPEEMDRARWENGDK